MIALGMPSLAASTSANDDWTYIGVGGNGSIHADTLIGDLVIITETDYRSAIGGVSYATFGSEGTVMALAQTAWSEGAGKAGENYRKTSARVSAFIATSNGAATLGGNSGSRYALTFRSVGAATMAFEQLGGPFTGASSDDTRDLSGFLTPRLPIIVTAVSGGAESTGTSTINATTATSVQYTTTYSRTKVAWRLDLQQTDSIRYQAAGLTGLTTQHSHLVGKVT